MNKNIKSRKLNRLNGYDYSTEGYYFITICTKKIIEWFGKVENNTMILNECGYIIKKRWLWLAEQYPYIKLDEFTIMPNHAHGIIVIVRTTQGLSLRQGHIYNRQKNLLSKIICAFKTTSSKLIHNVGFLDFQWQRSFHDHIIRNEKSLENIRKYIVNNPLKWELDKYNPINFLNSKKP